MRMFRILSLMLVVIAPSAFADSPYQVEMILVRQNAEPVINSRAAPEDWDGGAQRLGERMSPPRLGNIVDKLRSDANYTVLAHKAWEQSLGEQPVKIAITDGQEQFGQFPIEGVLNLQLGRFTDIDADFWINQFDGNGSVIASEHLSQKDVRTKNNQLNYLDGGHLALLIKITSLTAKPPSAPPPDMQD
ncbi:CsiV family protein [Pseudomonas sp. MUP55]|uniref:CsiV family protein n=1 Tax=Pseudomonas sp. MUP55 TaxID=3087234 RepID=UPI002A5ADF51|nr:MULTISPECIES: CsiV family protein [unclassified Pseudomonas]WPN94257.1 CsiV family protein [Pseudomonas sp. MUP56]WPN99784.1 CsiV family protein [Pseudomonas sp. MUP55]